MVSSKTAWVVPYFLHYSGVGLLKTSNVNQLTCIYTGDQKTAFMSWLPVSAIDLFFPVAIALRNLVSSIVGFDIVWEESQRTRRGTKHTMLCSLCIIRVFCDLYFRFLIERIFISGNDRTSNRNLRSGNYINIFITAVLNQFSAPGNI